MEIDGTTFSGEVGAPGAIFPMSIEYTIEPAHRVVVGRIRLIVRGCTPAAVDAADAQFGQYRQR